MLTLLAINQFHVVYLSRAQNDDVLKSVLWWVSVCHAKGTVHTLLWLRYKRALVIYDVRMTSIYMPWVTFLTIHTSHEQRDKISYRQFLLLYECALCVFFWHSDAFWNMHFIWSSRGCILRLFLRARSEISLWNLWLHRSCQNVLNQDFFSKQIGLEN